MDEFARRLRSEMLPVNDKFVYFTATPIADEDLRPYVQDPIAALPAEVVELLPKVGIVLVPYLERASARASAAVVYDKPAEAKLLFSTRVESRGESDPLVSLFFTVREEQVSDYHYCLYTELAALLAARLPQKISDAYDSLLREELSSEAHGEVDEKSWRAKQTLLRRPVSARKDGKPFRDYARQSFEDTMTLFLHGICCDIDVETGPRQLPSRYLRKRLEGLKSLFPPPAGHAVFPEDAHHHSHHH